jgi:hypothetical protein
MQRISADKGKMPLNAIKNTAEKKQEKLEA